MIQNLPWNYTGSVTVFTKFLHGTLS